MENYFKNFDECGKCVLKDTCPLGHVPISGYLEGFPCNERVDDLILSLLEFNKRGVKFDFDSLIQRFKSEDK